MFLGGMFTELLPVWIVLISITIVGWIIIVRIKKKYTTPSTKTIAFTMHELNKLHHEGLLSEEELERAKRSTIKNTMSTTTDIHSKPPKWV